MKCPACERRIEEKHKQAMLETGYWGTPDQAWRLHYDGREEGEKPVGDAIGVQYSRLYDAMCSQRTWTFADWDRFLHRHAVAGHAVSSARRFTETTVFFGSSAWRACAG